MIIGLVGFRYSGKTEVGKILSNNRFKVVSFGDEVRLERIARGLPDDYDLHKLGVDLRKEFGPRYWGARVLGKMIWAGFENYVAEGMRTIGDLEVFQNIPGFVLVGVTASDELRWERCRTKNRGRPDDTDNYEEFLKRDLRDRSSDEGGLQSEALFGRRKYTMDNDGDLINLEARTINLLQELNSLGFRG
ncbi:MAG: hypothetical protein AABW89_05610 [Nanoarchaeota archaeon]